MSKKNRVVRSITIHVTENGSYKVGEVEGELRRHRHDLTWTQVKLSLKEFRAKSALSPAREPADDHVRLIKKAISNTFSSIPSLIRAYTAVPHVPPQGPVLDPGAYEKSPPYWIPGSPQRLHLIELVHAQARRLQLPPPALTEFEALLNPFTSPVHEKLADHVRCLYQLNEILLPS